MCKCAWVCVYVCKCAHVRKRDRERGRESYQIRYIINICSSSSEGNFGNKQISDKIELMMNVIPGFGLSD